MPLGAQIAEHLPYLRRYARALTGNQASGDAFVRATLEAAIADPALRASISGGRVPLYRAFTRLFASGWVDVPGEGAVTGAEPAATTDRQLARIAPRERQALLLTTLEDFSPQAAAEIMGVAPDEIATLIAAALREIADEPATQVLIIEDEPLIAMQLEDLVRTLGHEVCGTAATRTQAQRVVERVRPGLVLADIQLADGSSGIDAVEDILAIADVPVIFITAYPERLLTGDRPEPTYLVTKPFREETVRATISQALYLHGGRAGG